MRKGRLVILSCWLHRARRKIKVNTACWQWWLISMILAGVVMDIKVQCLCPVRLMKPVKDSMEVIHWVPCGLMIKLAWCIEGTCYVCSHCTFNLLSSWDTKLLQTTMPTYCSQDHCVKALRWVPWSQIRMEDWSCRMAHVCLGNCECKKPSGF